MSASHDAGTTSPVFEIIRVFHAPLEAVWRAWSEPERFLQWWGPKGCTVRGHAFDFREGGLFHYSMEFPGAPLMWGRFLYREIEEGKGITWLNSFATQNGGIARAPFSPVCPLEVTNAVTMSERAGVTTVKLRAQPFGASPVEEAFFAELSSSGSLAQGYGGTFDQLADRLAAEAGGG